MVAFGIGSQIKRAVSAVGSRNIAGQASGAAMRNAETTALRRGSVRSFDSLPSKPTGRVRRVHPGNSSGYKGSKRATIAPQNSGYGDKAMQTARYSRKKLPVLQNVNRASGRALYKDRSFDQRISRDPFDAASRLTKLMG